MLKHFLLALATGIIAVACSPAASVREEPWQVVERSGLVQIDQLGQQVRNAELNEVLSAGAAVTTGSESSATISNGKQIMTMAANSRVAIPEEQQPGMTHVLQNMGSILFQVDHREAPHFQVDTPLLAAIVKGTTFEVGVSGEGTTLAVVNGLVEVHSAQGGVQQDVATGRAARVVANAPSALVLISAEEARSDFASIAATSSLRGRWSADGDASSPNPAAMPAMNAAGGMPPASAATGASFAAASQQQNQATTSSSGSGSSSKSSTPKASEPQSPAQPFDSTGLTVALYVIGGLVAWAAFVVAFALGRSYLREMKAKAKKSRDE